MTTNPLNINDDGLQRFVASTGQFSNVELTTKGDILTRTASDYVRLAVGTDTHALVSDSTQAEGIKWGAVSSGSSVTYLANQSASSSSSVDFTAIDNATYAYYIFTYTNVRPSTDGEDFRVRFSIDGGSSFLSSGYDWVRLRLSASSGSDSLGENESDGKITVATDLGNGAGEGISGKLILIPPSTPGQYTPCTVMHDNNLIKSTGTYYRNFGGGRNTTSSEVDAIRFYFSSGNIAVGDFYMYGVKKS